jgi:uncharacterized alpha-E superfamily protein
LLALPRDPGATLPGQRQVIARAVFGADEGSVRAVVQSARREAMAVRPALSSEVYDVLTEMNEVVAEAGPHSNLHDLSRRVQKAVALLYGVIDESMAHDEPWQFLRLGRQLERAANVVRLVTNKLDWLQGTGDALEWAAVLRSCSSFEAYRWRLSTAVDAIGVARFLLLDRAVPRSARCAMSAGLESVHGIDGVRREPSEPHRLLGRLSALFEYTLAEQVVDDPNGFASAYAGIAGHLSRSLVATYFQPTRVPRGAQVAAPPIWARPPEMQQQ